MVASNPHAAGPTPPTSAYTPDQIQQIVAAKVAVETEKVALLRLESQAKVDQARKDAEAEQTRLDHLNRARVAAIASVATQTEMNHKANIQRLHLESEAKFQLQRQYAAAEQVRLGRITAANVFALAKETTKSLYEPIGNGGYFMQGPYGVQGCPKNLELVVLEQSGPPDGPKQLVHYYRDHTLEGIPWLPSPEEPRVVISDKATSEGSLLFSSHGRLEVLVNEGGTIAHYMRFGSTWKLDSHLNKDRRHFEATGPEVFTATGPSTFIQRSTNLFDSVVVGSVSLEASGWACLIQSTLSDLDGGPGKLQAIVLEHGGNVVHYQHEASVAQHGTWKKTGAITDRGVDIQPGSLMQSCLPHKPGAWCNFELILLESMNNGEAALRHWYCRNSDSRFQWGRGDILHTEMGDAASGALIQCSDDLGSAPNYEVVAKVGPNVEHYCSKEFEKWERCKRISRTGMLPCLLRSKVETSPENAV